MPFTVWSLDPSDTTGNAPAGFAESLPTGTVTGSGMPGGAVVLDALALRRYGVYVDARLAEGMWDAGVPMFSSVRVLVSLIVGTTSLEPLVVEGWEVTMATVPPGVPTGCFEFLLLSLVRVSRPAERDPV